MKNARDYIEDFDPAIERLEALIERAQRDAFAAGFNAASDQLFEIANTTASHIDEIADGALKH